MNCKEAPGTAGGFPFPLGIFGAQWKGACPLDRDGNYPGKVIPSRLMVTDGRTAKPFALSGRRIGSLGTTWACDSSLRVIRRAGSQSGDTIAPDGRTCMHRRTHDRTDGRGNANGIAPCVTRVASGHGTDDELVGTGPAVIQANFVWLRVVLARARHPDG